MVSLKVYITPYFATHPAYGSFDLTDVSIQMHFTLYRKKNNSMLESGSEVYM
jgi:hypothetical protein